MPTRPVDAKRKRRQQHRQQTSSTPPNMTPESAPADPVPTKYSIGGGHPEVLWIWTLLSHEERYDVLDVSPDEIALQLVPKGKEIPSEVLSQLSNLIDDATFMTSLRVMFVACVNSPDANCDIELPAEFPPLAFAVLRSFDRHLILTHDRYRSTALFIAFSVFVLLFTSSYGLVVKFLLGFTLSIAAVATGEQNIAIPDALFSALFCRNADRVDAFMANSILYSLCYWSPYSGFLKCVSVVPYALLMLQNIISVDDVAAFRFFYLALSFVLKLVVIYFSWFSWPWFTFTFALFLPKIFRLVVGFALLVSTVVIWVIDAIITLIPALNKLTSSLIDFAIFPFVAFYTLYFSSRIGLVFSLLLLPSLARTFATAMLSSVVPAVLDVFTPVAVIGFCRVTLAVSFVLTQEVAVRVFHIFRKLRS